MYWTGLTFTGFAQAYEEATSLAEYVRSKASGVSEKRIRVFSSMSKAWEQGFAVLVSEKIHRVIYDHGEWEDVALGEGVQYEWLPVSPQQDASSPHSPSGPPKLLPVYVKLKAKYPKGDLNLHLEFYVAHVLIKLLLLE